MPLGDALAMQRKLFSVLSICKYQRINIFCVVGVKLCLDEGEGRRRHRIEDAGCIKADRLRKLVEKIWVDHTPLGNYVLRDTVASILSTSAFGVNDKFHGAGMSAATPTRTLPQRRDLSSHGSVEMLVGTELLQRRPSFQDRSGVRTVDASSKLLG
jgi:hypothetical protein